MLKGEIGIPIKNPVRKKAPASIWDLSEEDSQAIEAADRKPRNILNHYERCALRQGYVDGRLWAHIERARESWAVKYGKKRAPAKKVMKQRFSIRMSLIFIWFEFGATE
jgi:hypothetical protein